MDSQLNEIFVNAREAARKLNLLDDATKNSLLLTLADAIGQHTAAILDANAKDLAKMSPENPKYDRLKLTEARLAGIAGDMRNVASLPSPLDKVLMESVLPNGLKIRKVSVPFGVIGVIYEARPNVSFDVFSLCFKSGSACVLKGGSDAIDRIAPVRESITMHQPDSAPYSFSPHLSASSVSNWMLWSIVR